MYIQAWCRNTCLFKSAWVRRIARHLSTVLWNPQRCTCQTYCCKCLSIVKNWDNTFSTWNEQYTRCRDFELILTRFYNCPSLSTSLPTTSTTPFTERSAAPSGCNIWLSQQQDGVACLFKGQGCNHVPIAKQVPTLVFLQYFLLAGCFQQNKKNEYVPPKNVPANPSNRHELDRQVTVESRPSTLQGRKQRVDPWLFAGRGVGEIVELLGTKPLRFSTSCADACQENTQTSQNTQWCHVCYTFWAGKITVHILRLLGLR